MTDSPAPDRPDGPPPDTNPQGAGDKPRSPLAHALGRRSLVLVGMMGSGKSTIGRRIANRLSLPFADADTEIERAARMTVAEIFDAHGEDEFRRGERRVIERLLTDGTPRVLATGGGAFMDAETRAMVAANGVSVWLKADLPVLMQRVRRRANRPLLKSADPEAVMRDLLEKREPVYALTDFTVHSRDVPHDTVVSDLLAALTRHLLQDSAAS